MGIKKSHTNEYKAKVVLASLTRLSQLEGYAEDKCLKNKEVTPIRSPLQKKRDFNEQLVLPMRFGAGVYWASRVSFDSEASGDPSSVVYNETG